MKRYKTPFFTALLGAGIGLIILGITLAVNFSEHGLALGHAGAFILIGEVIYWGCVVTIFALAEGFDWS